MPDVDSSVPSIKPTVRRATSKLVSCWHPKRWAAYALVVAILSAVSDGWSGKPSPWVHQIFLLPLTLAFGLELYMLLRSTPGQPRVGERVSTLPQRWWVVLALFEFWALGLIVAEAHHFQRFGYHLPAGWMGLAAGVASVSWLWFWRSSGALSLFTAVLATYSGGMLVAVRGFPLNYLRSDMLPVIGWAGERVLHHLSPYDTMRVGGRLYDFPYLPGMLIGYLPAEFLHLDLRVASWIYVVGTAVVIFRAARPEGRREVAALLGLFLLCPFLQYRHDLYLEPHWFAMTLAVVLVQRGRLAWSALVWGLGCGIYQLNWVVVPFFFLYAFRRAGALQAAKLLGITALGALLITGPFLRSASHRMARNTVGQWGHLPHALADPINVSYWLTYLIRPNQLIFVQAAVLTGIFGFCVLRRRCSTLTDTLRWMSCALAVFIPLNILVDGYFYLTLLLLLLLFVCSANDWWTAPEHTGPEPHLA